MKFISIEFNSPEYRSECELRDLVLRKPLGMNLFDEDLLPEEFQLHFGLQLPDSRLIACVIVKPGTEFSESLRGAVVQVRQMAVAPDFQGKGAGRFLLLQTEEVLRKQGIFKVVLHARKTASGFYSKLGYEVIGEEFIEVSIPHYRMVKFL